MSTREASLYLKEMLTGSGFDKDAVQQLGCHSLKCTMLSWLAMGSYASISDRRLAGHHLDANNVPPVTYSRDELTRVLAIEQRMTNPVCNGWQIWLQPMASWMSIPTSWSSQMVTLKILMKATLLEDLPGHTRTSFDDLTLNVVKNCRIHLNSGVCVTFLLMRQEVDQKLS